MISDTSHMISDTSHNISDTSHMISDTSHMINKSWSVTLHDQQESHDQQQVTWSVTLVRWLATCVTWWSHDSNHLHTICTTPEIPTTSSRPSLKAAGLKFCKARADDSEVIKVQQWHDTPVAYWIRGCSPRICSSTPARQSKTKNVKPTASQFDRLNNQTYRQLDSYLWMFSTTTPSTSGSSSFFLSTKTLMCRCSTDVSLLDIIFCIPSCK